MKAILMSIRPEWVAKILNGEKTIEIRKKFPRGYVGWVYIYCTKNGHLTKCSNGIWYNSKHGKPYDSRFSYYSGYEGKVVARFWVDKVGGFSKEIFGTYEEPFTYGQNDLLKKSCLTEKELDDYLQGKNGKAIHITKLEIFDKPKDISEFGRVVLEPRFFNGGEYYEEDKRFLTRAPRNGYCYIEV